MKNRVAPKARNSNLVVQESKDEVLIYDLNSDMAYCLNETSALVWQACDGSRDVPAITTIVGRHFKTAVSEDLVWIALDELKQRDLLESSDDIKIDFNGVSRREALRRVGFASLAALPVIIAMRAPLAAQAQSPACNTRSCSADVTCTSVGCGTCGANGKCRNP